MKDGRVLLTTGICHGIVDRFQPVSAKLYDSVYDLTQVILTKNITELIFVLYDFE